MNPNNYGTLEACQRLVDAGIVLETDFYWARRSSVMERELVARGYIMYGDPIPAPSMAEVWREYRKHVPDYQNRGKLWNALREENVVDALIDLLIWVKAQKEGA
jgi:hypothetical protein